MKTAFAFLVVFVTMSGIAAAQNIESLKGPEIYAVGVPNVDTGPALQVISSVLASDPDKACENTDAKAAPACNFHCATGDLLYVDASSTDTPPGIAHVYADADCAGIGAHCDGDLHCEGTSSATVPTDGPGHCSASTDEPWFSKDSATVTCSSAPAKNTGDILTLSMGLQGNHLVSAVYTLVQPDGTVFIYHVHM